MDDVMLALLVSRTQKGSGTSPAARETVEWHQCPEAVRNYLANVSYRASDYTVSQIEAYLTNTPADSQPVGKTVDGVTYYNQVPGVAAPFATANRAGTLKPLDRLRWIKVGSHGLNVRDLGGWACDGGTVRYGKLYRGGEVYAGDPETIRYLHDVGIRAELELQGTDVPEDYSVIGPDVDFCCPKQDGNYWAYYSLKHRSSMREAFRFIFDSVRRGRPVYFHCQQGADRTGTIACIIEALLGVSQPLCDMEYELTSFASSLTNTAVRKRNSTQWGLLIDEINALPVGSSFRDKIVNYIASLGFTADEINAFRASMIDGTPETVTPVIATYTISKVATGAVVNGESTARQYQAYVATVAPSDGYVISGIRVTMGGVDVTRDVFGGEKTVLRRSVVNALSHCTTDNERKSVIDGQSYGATITAHSGYTLQGVVITMGGMDVSTYYANGKITIPQVTGDIVITATAVASASAYTNQIPISTDISGAVYNNGLGYKDGARISSSGAESTLNGAFLTGFIPVTAGDTIYIQSGLLDPAWADAGSANSHFYASNKTTDEGGFNPKTVASAARITNLVTNSEGYIVQFSVKADYTNIAYIRLTLKGSGDGAVVTVNETIE